MDHPRQNPFPVPDPILRHIDPEQAPLGWAATPEGYEKSIRGRYAIVAICAGLHPALAWLYALDPAQDADTVASVGHLPDRAIEQMVVENAAQRRSEEASRRRAQ